jgi:hypothetical protein
MKLRTFLAIMGGLGVLFGLEFLLVPGFGLPQYGVPADPHNLMQARFFGGTLLAWGLVSWLARGCRDDTAVRAILQGSLVGHLLGAILSAWAAVSGLENAMAWSSVAIYGLLAAGCLYFLASPARRMSAAL